MPVSDKVREDRVRRALRKRGYVLKKTPAASWLREEYGVGYMVMYRMNPVLGRDHHYFDATLDEVEEFAFG